MSEEVILTKIFLDISVLDGLIARPHDDRGPIHEFFFFDETKRAGILVRESYDAAAVITGLGTSELSNGWVGNRPAAAGCFVVTTHEVPTDVLDGSSQVTCVTDGVYTPVVRPRPSPAGRTSGLGRDCWSTHPLLRDERMAPVRTRWLIRPGQ